MKVAVVVGHHLLSKGARSPLGNEFDLMSKVANGLNCDTFKHNPNIRGYGARQRAMSKKTKDYDIVFELHFNAATPSANGCEALYYYSNNEGKKICLDFCNGIEDLFGIRNRGAKPLHSKNQRGYGFLYNTKGTAIILEPFFGSSFEDCNKFDYKEYIDFLNKFIVSL